MDDASHGNITYDYETHNQLDLVLYIYIAILKVESDYLPILFYNVNDI